MRDHGLTGKISKGDGIKASAWQDGKILVRRLEGEKMSTLF